MELVIIDCLIMNYLFTISQVSQTPSTTGTTPQPTHFLVKQTDWCYILGSPNPLIGHQVKHLLILSFLLFSFISISCTSSSSSSSSTDNTTTTTWTTKQLGTSSDDKGNSVTTDSSDNIYVTGYTDGGLDGNTNSGESNIFLVKYNSSGTKQWTKQLGSGTKDRGYGVTTDTSGNVYVTGYTYGGLDGNTSSGDYDIFLVKYNSSGIKQ